MDASTHKLIFLWLPLAATVIAYINMVAKSRAYAERAQVEDWHRLRLPDRPAEAQVAFAAKERSIRLFGYVCAATMALNAYGWLTS